MRVIIFRGKRTEGGQWEYGDLWRHPYGKPIICIANPINGNGPMGGNAVDPETVGQFTGKYDRNGERIFEGDILKGVHGERLLVKFVNTQFILQKENGRASTWAYVKFHEIIGNIHDNPELMEGK